MMLALCSNVPYLLCLQKKCVDLLTSYYHQPLLPDFKELSGYIRSYGIQMDTLVDQKDTIYMVYKEPDTREPRLFAALQMVGYYLCLNVNPERVRAILNGPGYTYLKQMYNGKGQFKFRKIRPQGFEELQLLFRELSN